MHYLPISFKLWSELIRRIHPSSVLHRPVFPHLPLQVHQTFYRSPSPYVFLSPLSNLRRSRGEHHSRITDLDDAGADIQIDEGPSSAANKESDANQLDNAGAASAVPTPSRPSDSAQHRG
jgi:hypothetical protein